MSDELKRQALRYLAQRAERGDLTWTRPAEGVEKAHFASGETPGAEQAETRGEEPKQKTVPPRKVPATSGAATGEVSVSEASGGFERGAPEPAPVEGQAGELVDRFPDYRSLESFHRAIEGCQKCPLGQTRNEFVFGVGDPDADLVLVGEAPGAEEDRQGEPFVGRAGKLLDQILAAVDLNRQEGVYIANILKCRPPNNRDPQPAEVHECEPHLVKQLQLLQPKLIMALGRVAAQTLLRTSDSLSKMRGTFHDYHGIPLLVTFHPAALLRNPQWKRPTWEDVQLMKKKLDELRAEA